MLLKTFNRISVPLIIHCNTSDSTWTLNRGSVCLLVLILYKQNLCKFQVHNLDFVNFKRSVKILLFIY